MQTVATISAVRSWRRAEAGSVGLVPTMGYLHDGHLSLLRRAREENDRVAASLFVNPTQFGPTEDLAKYPRDLARDQRLLADAGCELLFAPAPSEVYPPSFETAVDVGSVAGPLEGLRRPGHFRGVATVVLKLFGVFEPTRAYFGEKDAQQLAVIRHLARDLDLAIEICGCPTVREEDGLAMSSRNSYLTAPERMAAAVLYRALSAAREGWNQGERRAPALRATMSAVLDAEPLATVDYAAAVDPETFQEVDSEAGGSVLLLLAVKIGPTRLLDNLRLDP
jgi:pantoate--beta-alanine ligase